jgi:hypothetical protein
MADVQTLRMPVKQIVIFMVAERVKMCIYRIFLKITFTTVQEEFYSLMFNVLASWEVFIKKAFLKGILE